MGAGGDQLVRGGLLEAVEQLTDRLVDAGDAGDRDGAGNDAHLVGGVARVVGLPQRIRTPPASDVTVDDGNEVDRLAGGLAQRDEERTSAGCSTVVA